MIVPPRDSLTMFTTAARFLLHGSYFTQLMLCLRKKRFNANGAELMFLVGTTSKKKRSGGVLIPDVYACKYIARECFVT